MRRLGAAVGEEMERISRRTLRIDHFQPESFRHTEHAPEFISQRREILAILNGEPISPAAGIDVEPVNLASGDRLRPRKTGNREELIARIPEARSTAPAAQ